MHCDAGDCAVGAVLSSGHTLSEPLPLTLIGTSSTTRELHAVLRALEVHGPALGGRVVRLYLDSFAAVRNLIKGGGPVQQLVRLCKAIHAAASARAVTIQPTWIPREWNTEADALSKPWKPNPQFTAAAHERIAEVLGLARAAAGSGEAVRYVPAPGDIAGVLQRVRAEGAVALLVAPEWPAQTWFQAMQPAVRARWRLGTANELWQREAQQQPYPSWDLTLFALDYRSMLPLTARPAASADVVDRERAGAGNAATRARTATAAGGGAGRASIRPGAVASAEATESVTETVAAGGVGPPTPAGVQGTGSRGGGSCSSEAASGSSGGSGVGGGLLRPAGGAAAPALLHTQKRVRR